jgi:hypothetical protein
MNASKRYYLQNNTATSSSDQGHLNFTMPRTTLKPLMIVDPLPSFAKRAEEAF